MRDWHQISFALLLRDRMEKRGRGRGRGRGRDEALQADRMSRFEAKGHARGGLPARRPTAGGVMRRSGIQAKAGDHGESVTVSSIHRDPFPPSATSVGAQIVRAQRGANKAGARQSVGNSAGAVIAAVIEGAMAAAVSIRFRAQLIRRPDGALDGERGVHWRQGQSATKPRLVSRGGWSRKKETNWQSWPAPRRQKSRRKK